MKLGMATIAVGVLGCAIPLGAQGAHMANDNRRGLTPGLILVAADAVQEANRKLAAAGSPALVLDDVIEALSAIIEEQQAQAEEIEELQRALLRSAEKSDEDLPERLVDIIERSQRRKVAR